jgi:DNA-binding IclR family transcriptional regulator
MVTEKIFLRKGRASVPQQAKTTMMIKSVEKALRILSYVASKPKVGPSEISRELKYNKSTVIRLLQTMEVLGFVKQQQETGRYELGSKVLELAQNYLEGRDEIISLATDNLQSLWKQFGETVGLYVREGDRRICIFRIESPQSLRYSVRVGRALPLYPGASGKVFLAYMAPHEVEALLAQWNVDSDRANRLRHELAEIRQKGTAFSIGEREPDLSAIAAPILNGRGIPVAVMFVSGPRQRLTSARLQEVKGPLSAAAQMISASIIE